MEAAAADHFRTKTATTSHAQRQLWFLFRAEGPTALYNMPLVLELRGGLDASALSSAFLDVLGRHEVLRTTLSDAGDEVVQVVHDAACGRAVFERRCVSADALEAEIAGAARHCFDLETEFPIRALLLEVAPEQHVFMLVMHHIAGDGWSFEPLARDLKQAYAARRLGQQPTWAPLPVQYADYAVWQKQVLGDERDADSLAGQQLAYWKDALQGIPEQLDLPTDRRRPAVASHRGGIARIALDATRHKALIGIARAGNGSLFMVLQAALAALLTRLGAGEDIPLGAPIAGRSDERLYDLVGLFLNALVLRVDTSGNPTFGQLLSRVADQCLNGFENAELPFDRVVEAVNPARSGSRHPLFQVLLVLQNNAEASFKFPGADVRVRGSHTGTSKFDLSFDIYEHTDASGAPAGLYGYLEYAT
ncbi:condensation domain-containing protein, partial [Tateyamaria omphalii]|uniref:condensation domain-containing protein n=1 Tax=Tateyamaria omphalii TaxID=299262 RepID=UPI001E4A1D55